MIMKKITNGMVIGPIKLTWHVFGDIQLSQVLGLFLGPSTQELVHRGMLDDGPVPGRLLVIAFLTDTPEPFDEAHDELFIDGSFLLLDLEQDAVHGPRIALVNAFVYLGLQMSLVLSLLLSLL
jgi:hypothetical protein